MYVHVAQRRDAHRVASLNGTRDAADEFVVEFTACPRAARLLSKGGDSLGDGDGFLVPTTEHLEHERAEYGKHELDHLVVFAVLGFGLLVSSE